MAGGDDTGGGIGAAARRLMRARRHAALATTIAGRPYVSLVAVACATDGSPLLLLSDLAQHTLNLKDEPRVSLLFAAAVQQDDPLAGPRLSVLGGAAPCDDPVAAARFAARHPESAAYAGFADFHLYRVTVERAHLVAGFGQIAWIENAVLSRPAPELAAAEPGIVAHMNADHADAVALYAQRLLGRPGAGWRLTGIDPEGIDLWRPLDRGGETARLDFQAPVLTPAAAQRVLVALARDARDIGPRP